MQYHVVVALALAPLAGCASGKAPAPITTGSTASVSKPSLRAGEIVGIERRRASAEIRDEDVSSRDLDVRRHAARALARIADDRAAKLLPAALGDEDPEVVAWAGYGLGWTCAGREPATVRQLAARMASLAAGAEAPSSRTATRLDPTTAIADGLGRCATSDAERVLRSWLDGPTERAEIAAQALARMANRQKRLDDATLVGLLDAASGEHPLENALLPFTRLAGLSSSVSERLLGVASESLTGKGRRRTFAVRALGRSGARGAETLARVVRDATFEASQRSDAARELGRLEDAGQKALSTLLADLTGGEGLASPKLGGAEFGPLIAVLEGLQKPAKDARAALEKLAALPLPGDAGASLARRVVTLRCGAAALLAGTASLDRRLVGCDPDPKGKAGALAVLKVLDRGKLTGSRYLRWKSLVDSETPAVREAAITLLGGHPEVERTQEIIAAGLGAKQTGVVAETATLLAGHPDRAARSGDARAAAAGPDAGTTTRAPDPAVVSALAVALSAERPADDVETLSALIDAAAALGVLSLKPRVEALCKSPNPTLRSHAEKALRVMGDKQRTCKEFVPPPAAEMKLLPRRPEPRLVFETEAGSFALRLDPELAPFASARVVALAKAGFYDGVALHRVVPGFVVQLGDPGGDGYGGAGKDPLPCETSPLPFDSLMVGVALSGRDTGSSQIFVTLGPFPHLDGDYALIGHAEPGWNAAAQGDVIQKVRVE